MATKSLLIQTAVDVVAHSHNCQANVNHRLKPGDARLKVRNLRGWDHYCLECAEKILLASQAKLDRLRQELRS